MADLYVMSVGTGRARPNDYSCSLPVGRAVSLLFPLLVVLRCFHSGPIQPCSDPEQKQFGMTARRSYS